MNAKVTVRNNIARLLFGVGVTRPASCSKGRLSIATFHRVLPEAQRQAYPYPRLVVTPQELDILLAYFNKHFDCGTLAAQHARYLKGESPERPLLALTFDDGQNDNFINARPVLDRHQIKASFFIPVAAIQQQQLLWHDQLGFAILALIKQPGGTQRLMMTLDEAGLSASEPSNLLSNVVSGSKQLTLEARLRLIETLKLASGNTPAPEFARLMTFEELAQLAHDGHEIGSHSMTHCLMPECDDSALAYEVTESRRVLQDRLGLAIETFCYPNGNADARTAHAVAQAGYRRAVTTRWGNNGPQADRFQLCRYDMTAKQVQNSRGEFEPALLAFRMSGFYPGLAACRT